MPVALQGGHCALASIIRTRYASAMPTRSVAWAKSLAEPTRIALSQQAILPTPFSLRKADVKWRDSKAAQRGVLQ
jgi:hypothetical protein